MARLAASLLSLSSALVLSASALAPAAHGQAAASLSGRVVDASGHPSSSAIVRLVSDTTVSPTTHPRRYTLLGDSLGKFSQEGIAPGAYLVMVSTDGKGTEVLRHVSLRPGESAVLTLPGGSQAPSVEIAAAGSSTHVPDRTARTR